ncbi:MAG: 50S ribosomal protein L3 [Candidatus Yanofskybacteria bacterium RIFCSPHIGHO2_01_FULL_48_25b]|uniref:50S ribosomal protein L3 n=2 Tax=Candidatus Yanofskyibacteriota TaxID=1752733 RepID=A0A1F8F3F5_9BACT|nr:MAG: 50S ribosomal protein L3 [Candidatus Yanofskybacteria bacterium RIFCSPHIGHO2_01_FULL_48_25b]
MSQMFKEDGTVIPVTIVQVQPNEVTQIRTKEKDKYEAIQVSIKKGKKNLKKEFRTVDSKLETVNFQIGDKIDLSIFEEGEIVKVSGVTKGKGFQGVVKRHGFHGAPASHGHHHVLRHGGSIGQRFPQHTLKGMRMAGRMGGDKHTTRGLKIAKIDVERGLVAIKGAIPGNNGSIIQIQSQ